MVDETLFDYLHMAVVDYYSKEDDNDGDSSTLYLSQIGRHVVTCRSVRLTFVCQATVLVTR